MGKSKIAAFATSTLTSAKVRLEPFEHSHVRTLLDIADDMRIWEFHPENRCERSAHELFLHNVLVQVATGTQLAWVVKCETKPELIGFVRLFSPDRLRATWEMGTWIVPACWGMGINKALKDLLLTSAFFQFGVEKIVFRTDTTNLRSQKAIQQLGAICTAYIPQERITWKGVLRDAYYYELTPTQWFSKGFKTTFQSAGDAEPEALHEATVSAAVVITTEAQISGL